MMMSQEDIMRWEIWLVGVFTEGFPRGAIWLPKMPAEGLQRPSTPNEIPHDPNNMGHS
jgi:hypothetical protein